jgi:hypothetical protein
MNSPPPLARCIYLTILVGTYSQFIHVCQEILTFFLASSESSIQTLGVIVARKKKGESHAGAGCDGAAVMGLSPLWIYFQIFIFRVVDAVQVFVFFFL